MTRILVVDDEPTVRSVLRDLFEIEDYEVTEAAHSEEALETVAQIKPDLIILNVMMPGMSGLHALVKIRKQYSAEELPVIILTASHSEQEAYALGANLFVDKPFDFEALLDSVQRLLNGERLATDDSRDQTNDDYYLELYSQECPAQAQEDEASGWGADEDTIHRTIYVAMAVVGGLAVLILRACTSGS